MSKPSSVDAATLLLTLVRDVLYALILIIIANGAPIIAHRFLRDRFAYPLDAGINFIDRQPLLGPSKTWRGLIASIVITTFAAITLGLAPSTGILVALSSMAGDLLSSFIKRRMHIPSSDMALGLDQIPEVLFPLLVLRSLFSLTWTEILILTTVFFIVELLLSRLLYKLHIRRRPY